MKLAVTGLGLVGPFGVGRAGFDAALTADDSELAFRGTPTVVGADAADGVRIAEVWGFDPSVYLGAKGHRNFDRLTKLQIVAAKQALEDASIKRDGQFVALSPPRVGVCSATAYGSLDEITELNRVAELEDPRYINPTRFPNTVINSAAGYVSIWEDLRAPNTTIADGNTGSLDAVLHGALHLERARADAMLVGGGEIVNDALVLAMKRLGVAKEPTFAMGEGAAFLVLERGASARDRGARVLAEVRGYGSAFSSPERESLVVHVDEATIGDAVDDSLRDAALGPADVDLVVSAASGLPNFDSVEARCLDARFVGARRLAPKRLFGESFGVAGAFGLAAAITELEGGRANHALVLAVGYYGNVSAVVLSRAPAA